MALKVKSGSKKKSRLRLSKKYIPVNKKRREKSFWHEVDETFFNFGKYGKRK